MRRSVLVFLPALVSAGAIASVAGACSSFEEGAESTADGSTSEASPAADAGTDGSRCTSVGSDFSTGKLIPGFSENTRSNGAVVWNQGEGVGTPLGALEAITPEGAQAQLEHDFPIGATKRARLAFSTRLKAIADAGTARTSVGCTMQLSTEDVDGAEAWVEIIFKHENGQILFDEDSHGGGTSIDSAPYANASDKWTPYEIELLDITDTTAKYRARVGTTEIPLAPVTLPSRPHHFHIKCGIDATGAAADTLTDDVTFEMCE